MNFVIYSYNFLPMTDAEAYCSTRFASALARAGHNVTVVTMDWPMQISQDNYNALVSEELKIIRLPFSNHKNNPLKALLWYGHRSQMAVDIRQSVKAVRNELRSMDKPILITRSLPLMCTMVGEKCRKYAHKWIAHFSDPVPWLGYNDTLSNRILRKMDLHIVNKTFKSADYISVTCRYINRYFKDNYPKTFDVKKSVYTPHIGDYRINTPTTVAKDETSTENIILHPGSIYADRGGRDISLALSKLGGDIQLMQIGKVDPALKELYSSNPSIIVCDTESLESSLDGIKKARAIFVPDFEVNLPYSPTLLSKFVYQIMDNLPIVLYCKKECEMYDYSVKFPDSGIFWAQEGDLEALKYAIESAIKCDATAFDRKDIREFFSEETIISNFIAAISE